MTGTLINAGAILIGSTIGLIAHKKLPQKITKITFQAIGLFTMFVGIQMALKSNNYLLLVFSLLIGGVIGSSLEIENKLQNLSKRYSKKNSNHRGNVTEAIITSFLLFCMGSMSILGSIEDGMGQEPKLLLAKSVLDGFSSIALTAALGMGVLFSIIPLLIFQGGITLLAGYITLYIGEPVINELSAVGGLLLIGLALGILEIKQIQVTNMLPSLVIIIILGLLFI